jgi:hypothetical protein
MTASQKVLNLLRWILAALVGFLAAWIVSQAVEG